MHEVLNPRGCHVVAIACLGRDHHQIRGLRGHRDAASLQTKVGEDGSASYCIFLQESGPKLKIEPEHDDFQKASSFQVSIIEEDT